MKSWFGSYSSSFGGEPVEATVLASEKKLTIGYRNENGQVVTFEWLMEDVHAKADLVGGGTKVTNNKEFGKQVLINGQDAFIFINEQQKEISKPWHRKNRAKEWGRNSLLFLGISGLLVTAYFLLVPWLSEQLSKTISIDQEEQFGGSIYDALGLSPLEDKASTAIVGEFFKEMNTGGPYHIKLTVVNSDEVNAFALPGGHIVVYTALLRKLKSYPELAALLSHEFIHVNKRHATRSVFRRLGSRIFLSALFGKFGTVASVMADQADNLKSLNYSRRLEKEADLEGLAILKQRKIDPQGFVHLFEQLKSAGPDTPEFMGSHPDIENRIAYIRANSADVVVVENVELKAIFEKLNNK